ncbi:PepSY domain-containing protein [Lactobacillus sp. PV034]|uniref:PepSY domain-containing protein n=1 Tax=Lactobacillus sp. PV034 TaxID=2594495 RepID=UPI00223FB5E9|nr:PepSY domain-containing protein [Lactobacillus sp. PV034]QNQ81088.1 hypothetical protein FP432_05710 [Lactobacillus sp. PV034]
MTKKWTKLAAGVTMAGALLLTATACSNNEKTEPKTAEVTKKAKVATIKLSQADAISKFHKQYSGKDVKEINLKPEKNKYVYEIEGFDRTHEYEVKIDANTGKILSHKSEKSNLDQLNEQALDVDKLISRNQATKIAEKKVKGTATAWDLTHDNKKTVWEVEVTKGNKKHEVTINAETKKVISVEKDD